MIKTPNKNTLKEEKFSLAHGFRSLVHGGPTPLLWAQGENIMAEGYGGRVLLASWQLESREKGIRAAWKMNLPQHAPYDPPALDRPCLLTVTTQ